MGAAQQDMFAKKEDKEKNEKKVTLEDQIVQTNPVLEAFGLKISNLDYFDVYFR